MPLPVTAPIGYGSTGITTIVWGTDGLAEFQGQPVNNSSGAATFAGNGGYYIITDYRQRLKKDMEYGENGSGVQSRRTAIIHGQQWDITVEDDANMTPPTYGTAVHCYDLLSKSNNTGVNYPTVGTGSPAIVGKYIWSATVVDSEYSAAPKQPGKRVIVCENLTLVDPQTAPSAFY